MDWRFAVLKEGLLLAIIIILIIVATAMGIFYHTNEADIEGVSARGQHVTYQGEGLYRYNPISFAQEGVVWDVVNLFIGIPLLILSGYALLRNSLRGRLSAWRTIRILLVCLPQQRYDVCIQQPFPRLCKHSCPMRISFRF